MASAGRRIRLVGVFAHPDDDAYTLGGSLALNRDRLDATLVFCTSGDAGPIWVDGIATRDTLGRVREQEQADSMAALGVEADVRFLRHPDYHLPEVPIDHLVEEIGSLLREVRPHVVVTFGPDGLTGHHDHIRAGEAADAAFQRTRGDVGDGDAFARLLHVAIPRSAVGRFTRDLGADGDASDREARSLLDLRGVPDERIGIAVDTRSVLHSKLAGILAHRTQIGELERIPEPLRWIVLDTEWFVRSWPPGSAEPTPSADLLADLPNGPG